MSRPRTLKVDGVWLVLRRSIVGWIAVLSPDFIVSVCKDENGMFTARRMPRACHHGIVATGPTIKECFRAARQVYLDHVAEVEKRIIEAWELLPPSQKWRVEQ